MSSAEVYVLQWPELAAAASLEACLEGFPVPLAEGVRRYRQADDRWRVASGKLLLAYALRSHAAEYGLSALHTTNKGRPFFPGALFDFNISHSGDLVVLAWRSGGRVGVDVERHRPVETALFRRNFTDGEWAQIGASADPAGRFFHFWAIKESLIKADGRGVEVLGRTEVLDGGRARCDGKEYHFRSLDLAQGYSAAVASDSPLTSVEVVPVAAAALSSPKR